MDLRTFVSEAITQIVEGVSDAGTRVREASSNARVNPVDTVEHARKDRADPQDIEFDVAVTVTDQQTQGSNEKIGGKAGFLSVVSLQASAEIAGAREGVSRSETVSRVRFSVKVALPADIREAPKSAPISMPSGSYV